MRGFLHCSPTEKETEEISFRIVRIHSIGFFRRIVSLIWCGISPYNGWERMRSSRNNKYTHILNYGGGVNSTALLVLAARGMLKDIDPRRLIVLFADTGAERPYTYEYLNLAQEYCKRKHISFETVRAHYTLEEYVYHSGILPSRSIRWCTHRLKIRPIRRRACMHDVAKPYYQLIGFDTAESTRVRQSGIYKDAIERFPLVELGLDRQDCMSIVESEDLPVPKKSSCFCCPFQGLSSFLSLVEQYPELAERALRLETVANLRRKDGRAFYIFKESIATILARKDEITECQGRRGI